MQNAEQRPGRIDVMGIGFDNVTLDEAISRTRTLLQRAPGERTACCVTPNAEIAWEAMHDPGLLAVLNSADMVLPDGAGIVLGAKILGTPLKQKVAGVDFAAALLQELAGSGQTLYLLGSRPGIAEQAAEKMCAQAPGLQIVGMADGYFQDEAPVLEAIRAARPDVLFVCLGAPKQELFMAAHRDDLPVRFMIGLGGSLDSFAGTVRRAPRWMIRLNLEWLYRLIREPWRLKRMMRLPKFVLAVLKRRITGK